MTVQRRPVPAQEPLPFGAGFQKSLLKLILQDDGFAHLVMPYLHGQFFENEVLGWVVEFARAHNEHYQCFPSLRVLRQEADRMDPNLRMMYVGAVDQIASADLRDEFWMRDKVLDWVKRNIFVRAFNESRVLYNSGKTIEAYDTMMERMELIYRTTWEPYDESNFFESLPARQSRRMNDDPYRSSVGTGIPALDHGLSGGLSLGELAVLIAYAKCGKTTYLVNFGVAATRLNWQPTAHFIFESRRQKIEDRYDAAFMDEFYNAVKKGELSSSKKYAETYQLYQELSGLLKIRGFTEKWSYTVADIDADLKRWKREDGFHPRLIIVDYGDLVSGREGPYRNETAKQKDAFRDLKSLANRGYAVWTASQAQRPAEGSEDKEHLLRSRQIADCYEKVRVAECLCTQNVTREERRAGRSRLLFELYRENEADIVINMVCDFSKMMVRQSDAALGEYPSPAQQKPQPPPPGVQATVNI